MTRNKPLFFVAFGVLLIVIYLLLNNKIDFSKYNGKTDKDLVDFNARLQYVLVHFTPAIASRGRLLLRLVECGLSNQLGYGGLRSES